MIMHFTKVLMASPLAWGFANSIGTESTPLLSSAFTSPNDGPQTESAETVLVYHTDEEVISPTQAPISLNFVTTIPATVLTFSAVINTPPCIPSGVKTIPGTNYP